MAENIGTKLAAEAVTPDSADLFALLDDKYLRGGLRIVSTLANRNSIPTDRRKWGMWVIVAEDPTPANNGVYELKKGSTDNDITNNANFIEAELGVSFTGINGQLAKFDSTGENIENSNIRQLNGQNFGFGGSGLEAILSTSLLSTDREIFFPNKSGTLALLSDVQGNVPTDSKNNYLENTLYDTPGEIIYYINAEGETLFYEVLQSFTSQNLGNIDASLAEDISLGNLEIRPIKGLTLEPHVPGNLYPQYGLTFRNGFIYRTSNETTADPANGSPWSVIGWTNDLTENYTYLGDGNNKASQIEVAQEYIDNVGDTFLTPTYLITNYSTAVLSQKVESTWQVAEKTQSGWKISKKNEAELIKRPLDLSNTDYWDAVNREIDLSHLAGVDLVEVDTTYTPPVVDTVSTDTPAVIVLNTTLLLQNDQLITIDGTNYMIKGINQVAGSFELYDTDGTTPIDGNSIQTYSGMDIIQTSGVLSLQIDKIIGIPNNYELQIKGTDENEISINRVAVSGATVDQIVGAATGNLTVSGKSKIKVTRDGIVNIAKLEINVV